MSGEPDRGPSVRRLPDFYCAMPHRVMCDFVTGACLPVNLTSQCVCVFVMVFAVFHSIPSDSEAL